MSPAGRVRDDGDRYEGAGCGFTIATWAVAVLAALLSIHFA